MCIQEVESPDARWLAEVWFMGVGAYSSGNGRITVNVRPRALPALTREVYYVSASYADENTRDYVRWPDSGTLYAEARGDTIPVRAPDIQVPGVLILPVALIIMVSSVITGRFL